jgi:hypothetical protein
MTYFSNKNAITLMRIEKGMKVNWAQIIYNSLCNELEWWYKYVKENKGDMKDTCKSTLILVKVFKYMFVTKRKIHKNHMPRSRELKRRCRQHWRKEKKL